jgi:hypothetical protein
VVIERIRKIAPPGTVIPKPAAKGQFRVKGNGMRRGEDAIIYTIPNHSDPNRPHQKGVTASELERAHDQLTGSGEFTHEWWSQHLPACAREGSCNFTSIGGFFVLLGDAEYEGRGVYRQMSKGSRA